MNKKTIFITGATSGIGRIITELCIKKGYVVYATGRNESSLATLSRMGAKVFQGDLSNLVDIDRVYSQLPPIDIAIINAGVGTFESAYDLLDEEIDNMIDINIKAPIYLTKRLAKQMIIRKSGHIIFIGSQAGKVPTKKASVYAASKHAITGFANGLRMELSPYNIQVTAVYPGPIDTPFLQKADSTNKYREVMERYLLKPENVAREVVRTIDKPVREVNLPRIMSATSKLYAIAPRLVEKLGSGFFNKK
ncbi:SDR family NAD(P)-dependent oxidoreductase [Ureibacillus aquaedulcis]|uniref:SDR family NAD(P)-dependent oxidoreductase n=1 Tax=Ureibacillus aquaedulcis TaxID=3058421 RepID=A0ABT8GPW5_9BACL|nr:SDR family NAD(P)-dependent oxidoreductase [Ureibacillus sp. BA0131]MDN4493442.1 SDR family NAD(P)-dependent oxidoreductase [Ureibacillus sp. BA0131]